MGQDTTPVLDQFEDSPHRIESVSIDSNQSDAPEQHEHPTNETYSGYSQSNWSSNDRVINQSHNHSNVQHVQAVESPALIRTDSSTALLSTSSDRLDLQSNNHPDDEQKSTEFPNYQSIEQFEQTVAEPLDIAVTSAAVAGIKPDNILREDYPDVYDDVIEAEISIEEEDNEFPSDYEGKYPFRWKKFAKFIGPSALMAIAYLDPGNLESDLQAGSRTGYQLLWLLLGATVIGYVMQCLSVRLGVATGLHLAQHCRASYSRKRRLMLWMAMEAAVIGADIQEILGSALALQLLFDLPIWAGVLITAADTFIFLFLPVFGIRKLEAFFGALISIMLVCFFVEFGMVQPEASSVFRGFVPGLESYAVLQAVGLLGSLVMPHSCFLNSALVQSRAIQRAKRNRVEEAIRYYSLEAVLTIGVSFLINFAVVCVFAKGFWSEECAKQGLALVNGVCSDEIGFTNAGDALEDLLGGAAKTVWAIGLLASGQASTMTGVQAGQFIMSGFLDLRIKPWQRLLFTRTIAMVPAVAVALASVGDHTTLDVTTQFINVAMSILLPFSVLPLLHFTSNKTVMGTFVNSKAMMIFGWTFSLCAICINMYLVIQLLIEAGLHNAAWAGFVILFILYFCLVMWVLEDELKWLHGKIKRTYYNRTLQPVPTRSMSMDSQEADNNGETEMTTTKTTSADVHY